jgi:AraC-like DNA-binding protein
MQLAAELLRTTSASLAEIASRVGYGLEAPLSRAFKRLAGVSPANWRLGESRELASSGAEASADARP